MSSPFQQPAVPQPPAALPATSDATDIWDSTSEAVADILECADIAVAAIASRAEQQVFEDAAAGELRAAEETARRREQLKRLRWELGERATALSAAYNSILTELEALDRALTGFGVGATSPQAVAAGEMKVTLRERQRFHFAGEIPSHTVEQPPQRIVQDQHPVQDARDPWQRAA